MTAKHFTELVCWQLSDELKLRVYAVLANPRVARDFGFCDQLRDAVRSAPRNIAEGFGKFDPPEFRRYLNIAAGSLHEIQNHLRDGLSQEYIEREEFDGLWLLSKRARAATLALMAYLEKCPRKRPRNRRTSEPQNPRTPEPQNPKRSC